MALMTALPLELGRLVMKSIAMWDQGLEGTGRGLKDLLADDMEPSCWHILVTKRQRFLSRRTLKATKIAVPPKMQSTYADQGDCPCFSTWGQRLERTDRQLTGHPAGTAKSSLTEALPLHSRTQRVVPKTIDCGIMGPLALSTISSFWYRWERAYLISLLTAKSAKQGEP